MRERDRKRETEGKREEGGQRLRSLCEISYIIPVEGAPPSKPIREEDIT